MKEAIKVDLNGKYIEPVIVDKSLSGILPQYITPAQQYDEETGEPIGDAPEPVLDHYIIAIRPVDGLYEPTFDLVSYDEAKTKYDEDYKNYLEQLKSRGSESELESPTPPVEVNGSSFWKNGLTDEEIEALNPVPVPVPEPESLKQEIELLRSEYKNLKLQLAEQAQMITSLTAMVATK